MAIEPDPRVDSARLTSAFYEQLRSSKDDFLLDGQELTLDHVNRLSTEPDDDADSFAQSKRTKDRGGLHSSYNTAGSDLLPLGSEDGADTWDMPSPSTASFSTHTPVSHLDDDSSAISLEGPTSKRARMQHGTPGSTRATMQSGGTPASASSTARGPFTPAAGRSSKQLQAPARSVSRRQSSRELSSRPETPQSAGSTPSSSRIPKPSPTYASPHKSLGGGTLPHASPHASRIPPAPGVGPASPTGAAAQYNRGGGTAVSQPRADSASSVAQRGQDGRPMKPARDYGEKFSQMWSADHQGRLLQENLAAEASGQLPGPSSPSRIPSPSKAGPSQHGDDVIMTDAEGLPPSRIPPPPSPDRAVAAIRTHASADSSDSSNRSAGTAERYGRSGSVEGGKPWHKGGGNGTGDEDEADIYTPTSQKRKDAMSHAEALLHESKPSDRAEPGAFTQAMEADKAVGHTSPTGQPSPPTGPLTAALQSQRQQNGAEASGQQQAAADNAQAEHRGVGSRKHKRQNSNLASPQSASGSGKKPGCCGCSIM